jgi:hypothetical protein
MPFKKIKCLSLLALVFLTCRASFAQFDTTFAKTKLLRCADSLVDGFKTKNWDRYARYSYPALIGTLGGRDAFIEFVSQKFRQIPDTAWKKYEPGSVLQIIKTAGDLQAIVELHSIIEWDQVRITTTHHLVAESWNGGMFWTFFDSQNNREFAAMIKPDLSDQLVIPKRVEFAVPMSKRQ